VRSFIENIREAKSKPHYTDFSTIDILHPCGHEGLQNFLTTSNLKLGSHILDIGCGLGGSCRYLTDIGYKATGIDILSHYIELANEITDTVGMKHDIEFRTTNIVESRIEGNYDAVLFIGVIMNITSDVPAARAFECLGKGGLVYLEDYYLAKKTPLTEEEQEFMHDFHKLPYRTKEQFYTMFQSAGFEIQEIEEFSVKWSEYAWNRSERILRKHINNPDYTNDEVRLYGTISPKMLSHMGHYSQEALIAKFPLTCQRIGTDYAFKEEKLVGVIRFIAKKI
jgi:cyclopropane fatty-acyl-phospholipid synthase-like methyltransferase